MSGDIRERSREMLASALDGSKGVAASVEEAIYEDVGSNTHNQYRSLVRSKLANLRENPALASALIKGSLTPKELVGMSLEVKDTARRHVNEQEMASTTRHKEDQEIEAENTRQSTAIDTHEPHAMGEPNPAGGQEGLEFEHTRQEA